MEQTRDDRGGVLDPAGAVAQEPASARQTASPKAEEYRRRAADTLERTADKVRAWSNGARGGERAARLGAQAAGGMDRASAYLRERSVEDLSGEAATWVKQNPGPALAGAAAVGFLAGIVLRRR